MDKGQFKMLSPQGYKFVLYFKYTDLSSIFWKTIDQEWLRPENIHTINTKVKFIEYPLY